MSRIPALEILVGLFVALGVSAVFILTFRVSDLAGGGREIGGYRVEAAFENVGGLKVGAPVSMAGVRIGRVAGIRIDPDQYDAVATLEIGKGYGNIPDDSSASIYTAGLLGEQYVGIEAGGSARALQDGDTLKFTQSALVLERIIGQVLFSITDRGNADAAGDAPPAPGASAAGTP